MVTYVLKNKITGDYIGKAGNDKYMNVKNEDEAFKFDSCVSASRVAKNCLGKSFDYNNYLPIMCGTKEVIKNGVVNKNYLKSEYLNDIQDKIYSAISFINDAYMEESSLQTRLKEVDKKIIDVEHYIEFSNLNAADGYKIYKIIKKLRVERREIKDKLAVIDSMKQNNICSEGLCKVFGVVNGLDERVYCPRTADNIFDS